MDVSKALGVQMNLRFRTVSHGAVIFGMALLLLLTFTLWYRPGERLSSIEQQSFLQAIAALSPELQEFINPAVVAEFMANDDGHQFYVINLFRFKQFADAVDGLPTGSTGQEAFTQFSRAAIPLWLRFGTHPVFATRASDAFSEEWDAVSIVRYRSRRDFMAIQTSAEYHEILPYRLAATEQNIRLKLPAILIPPPLLLLLLLCLLGCLLTLRRFKSRQQPRKYGSESLDGNRHSL